MAETDITPKFDHVMRSEDVLYQTIVFAEVKSTAFGGDDSGRILAAMLEDRQTVDEHLVHVGIFVCQ